MSIEVHIPGILVVPFLFPHKIDVLAKKLDRTGNASKAFQVPAPHFEDIRFVLILGMDEYIVNIDNDEVMKVRLEHLVHKSLKYRGSIGQAIWHEQYS